MREAWKDEGKEDSEGRSEWERRWREAEDIMNEEDVMEISIMHSHSIPLILQLFIRTPSGSAIPLEVESTDTIKSLKEKINDKEGIPINKQRFIFSGKVIKDGCTLQDYNIPNDGTVHLMPLLYRRG